MARLHRLVEKAEPHRLAIERFEEENGRPPVDAEEAGVELPENLTYSTQGNSWDLTWFVNPDGWSIRRYLGYHPYEPGPSRNEMAVGKWHYYQQD